MYYVNPRLIAMIRLSFPVGIALSAGYILDWLKPVAQYALVFLVLGFLGNYYFPEKIIIRQGQLGIKTVLAKNCKIYNLEMAQISINKRASYIVLKLDRKYFLELSTMSKDLYYQLKPYLKRKN